MGYLFHICIFSAITLISILPTSGSSIDDICFPLSCKKKSSLECQNSTPRGRCCVITSENVIYITKVDLSNCNLQTIDKKLTNHPNLTTILLQGNNLTSITREDFYQTTQIDLLVLQPNLRCPGGPNAWESYGPDHKTDTTRCKGEIQTCQLQNVTCPNTNSVCQHVGPNMMECVCVDGYHGYKCLRSGQFPSTWFMIGLAVCTVVLSMGLWLVENRCKRSTRVPTL
ncbi:all-trans retinoic acid-induced differentiation factor-like [Ylistrum balloti]|uniref:all-trans retinoic acid-induced differentiation factor-like n=1 Tax=Ylistrum balloti TaxID=509963 RepID=UPI002905AE19|nr:all-trans retinoic acid-induced differentiation factor-like [Ylistrum balloti]